jgi:hypothetical protein
MVSVWERSAAEADWSRLAAVRVAMITGRNMAISGVGVGLAMSPIPAIERSVTASSGISSIGDENEVKEPLFTHLWAMANRCLLLQ